MASRVGKIDGAPAGDTGPRLCDWPGCGVEAPHRAPRSRNQLNVYNWFCLDHVRAYNKSWNYYHGMSQDEVEADLRHDTVWQRPSWPLGAVQGAVRGYFRDGLGLFDEPTPGQAAGQSHHYPPSSPEARALSILDIKPPVSIGALKARYKELVKQYHPDVTGGDKESEERFKQVSQAYQTISASLAS